MVASIAGLLHNAGFAADDVLSAVSALCERLPGMGAADAHAASSSTRPARVGAAAPLPDQIDLPLSPPALPSNVVLLGGRRRRVAASAAGAYVHFDAAVNLEEQDAEAARAAYEACLEGDCDHLEARINLGRLLHLAGELKRAERIYMQAKRPNAMLHFNFAILLEDMKRERESMLHYRSALALDPVFTDAHFNLARLYERAQQPREALRHLLAYRRLVAPRGQA